MRANVPCPIPNRLNADSIRHTLATLVTAGAMLALIGSGSALAETLPVETTIEARLLSTTGSRVSHIGDPISATVIAPVTANINGELRIIIPPGSTLLGTVREVNRLGLGLRHSSAAIRYNLDSLVLPGKPPIPISERVVQIETAKEDVDIEGTIYGTHPTASVSSTVSFYTLPLIYTIPVLRIPVWTAKFIIARSPDPEIYFPAGTEVLLRLTRPVDIPVTPLAFSFSRSLESDELHRVEQTLRNAALTRAEYDKHASDLVNVMLLGSKESVERAFQAAGWSGSEHTCAISLYKMYHSVLSRKGYTTAPMDRLTLNGQFANASFQKSLDTFAKRHHVRFWRQPAAPELRSTDSNATEMWLGAATEDVGFRVRHLHMSHAIDPHVDNERAKVVNDLVFTGCVDSVTVAPAVQGSLGTRKPAIDQTTTDGNVAVLKLNACEHPSAFPTPPTPSGLHRRNAFVRTLLAIRDDIPRSNVLFIAYDTIRLLATHPPTFAREAFGKRDHRNLQWLAAAQGSKIASACPASAECVHQGN